MTKPKLLDQVRDRIQRLNYAYSTKKAYLSWIRRFILFHDKRHPSEMGEVEIETFLTCLAVVLSKGDVRALLNQLSGTHLLICQLLYGCGLGISWYPVLKHKMPDQFHLGSARHLVKGSN